MVPRRHLEHWAWQTIKGSKWRYKVYYYDFCEKYQGFKRELRWRRQEFQKNIWNPIHLDKIRQNRLYSGWYVLVRTSTWYVPVRTGTWRYMNFTSVHGSTYWYVRVRTFERTCGLLTHPGSVLRVKNNHAQLLCKANDMMLSNFQKCKVWRIIVHTCMYTYWYILVQKHSSFESSSIRFPRRKFLLWWVSAELLACSSRASCFTAVSSTVGPPRLFTSEYILHTSMY